MSCFEVTEKLGKLPNQDVKIIGISRKDGGRQQILVSAFINERLGVTCKGEQKVRFKTILCTLW